MGQQPAPLNLGMRTEKSNLRFFIPSQQSKDLHHYVTTTIRTFQNTASTLTSDSQTTSAQHCNDQRLITRADCV